MWKPHVPRATDGQRGDAGAAKGCAASAVEGRAPRTLRRSEEHEGSRGWHPSGRRETMQDQQAGPSEKKAG